MGTELTTEYLELYPTGHVCADCGDQIKYAEEGWLLQIVQPQRLNGVTYLHNVIDENDPDGDFLYDPYFFCFECMETLLSDLRDEIADEPPVKDLPGHSGFECFCCSSEIRKWEYTGSLSLGEFRVSKRAPNGVRGPHFVPNCEPELVCIYCLVLLNEGWIDMWENLSHTGECNDCIQLRCWRYGGSCSCACHNGTVTEVTQDGEQNV
jgi:hypothetical protein